MRSLLKQRHRMPLPRQQNRRRASAYTAPHDSDRKSPHICIMRNRANGAIPQFFFEKLLNSS